MSTPYRAVQWTKQKFFFDLTVFCGIFFYLSLFVTVSISRTSGPDYAEAASILVRAFGTLAVLLLHVVLAIGPLARWNPAFLILLQNRRHLGVMTFGVAAVHASLAAVLFHTGGPMNPLASIVMGNGQVFSPAEWPFEIFGLLALLILAMQAVTSHDFWISYLSKEIWKRMQMLGYAAYGLVLCHLAFGVLQETANPIYALMVISGMGALLFLHRRASKAEQMRDAEISPMDHDGFVPVCTPSEIPVGSARIVCAGGERIAVFRHWQGISAVSNVCAHQGGPLGEGTMVAGCVRCPWHGSMYFPQTGISPPPGMFKVHTFPVKLVDGSIYVSSIANPLGMETPPLPVPGQKGRTGTAGSTLQVEQGVVSPKRRDELSHAEET